MGGGVSFPPPTSHWVAHMVGKQLESAVVEIEGKTCSTTLCVARSLGEGMRLWLPTSWGLPRFRRMDWLAPASPITQPVKATRCSQKDVQEPDWTTWRQQDHLHYTPGAHPDAPKKLSEKVMKAAQQPTPLVALPAMGSQRPLGIEFP